MFIILLSMLIFLTFHNKKNLMYFNFTGAQSNKLKNRLIPFIHQIGKEVLKICLIVFV